MISKGTYAAIKRFNAEKLEMFPKAYEPEHLKLLCIESCNGSICSFPNHSFGMLVQATSKVTVLAYWMRQ